MMNEKQIKCFVIMPFSKTTLSHTEGYWTDHFGKFLKPLIEKFGNINVERSKAIRGDIVREIISNLLSADIVVADLTDSNANVYWELGVRQSFKHRTITIAQDKTKLPFDISGKGTLFYYCDNHIKNSEFEENLKEAINDCIKNAGRPDSHVLETITGRGSFYEIIHREEIERKLTALIFECYANSMTYDKISNRAKKNDETNNQVYITTLMRLPAVELLITNRYLNANREFYLYAEKYFDHLSSVNGRLLMWPNRPKSVDRWLIRSMNKEKYIDVFINQIKIVIDMLDGLS